MTIFEQQQTPSYVVLVQTIESTQLESGTYTFIYISEIR